MTTSFGEQVFDAYLESAGNYLKFFGDGLLSQNLWESDLVKGEPSYKYCVLFDLPKEQTALCYGCLYNSFSIRG